MVDVANWLKRADELINQSLRADPAEGMQFATSMIAEFYGSNSPQMKTFRQGIEIAGKWKDTSALKAHAVFTIKSIKENIEAGLIKHVRATIAGEIITELISLAKERLSDASDSGKNVGAVLVAAAFEDTMRRMGTELAGVAGRPHLQDVIIALKDQDVLKGAEPGIAQGYLKFRNISLHADWSQVDRSAAHSCLAFIEQLLMKHFS